MLVFLFATLSFLRLADTTPSLDWPQFRGTGSSSSQAADLPLHWSAEDGIAWQVDLVGSGQSAPVIWRDHLYVTSTVANGLKPLVVTALHMADGRLLWQKHLPASQPLAIKDTYARAAATPAADATGVIVFFGSGDLVKLSHQGEVVWSYNLTEGQGPYKGNHGLGSSPVLQGERAFILITHEGPSYLLALDAETGGKLWQVPWQEKPSWTTPLPVTHRGIPQLIISANGRVAAIDSRSGATRWFTTQIHKNNVPSPVRYKDKVILPSSEAAATAAISLDAQGELLREQFIWSGGWASSFGSPLVYADKLYLVNRSGALACMDAAKGNVLWKHRLPASCWATPIAVVQRLYFFTKDGETVVLDGKATEAKVLAVNTLPLTDEDTVYGVAASPDGFAIRTGHQITLVGGRQAKESEEL